MTLMRIININGPINSGKSTISKMLAEILPQSLFIEVDNLLSDEEQAAMNLSMEQGWGERIERLNVCIEKEKQKKHYQNIIFAYPITEKLYRRWVSWENGDTSFISITLSPNMTVCLQDRGERKLDEWERTRIKEMYGQGYQNPQCSDFVVDNSTQTPKETLALILSFLEGNI